MQRFKKILYVTEPGSGARTAPQRAVALARNNKARLTLCYASPELPRTLVHLAATYKKLHRQQLEEQFAKIDLKGIKTRTQLLEGSRFVEIIREVQREGHDLVIKSAEGGGGRLSYLFGETDMNLLRKCPCPVWIVKPARQANYSRIVAAVDPDPAIPANAELNKQILDLAMTLARQEKSELHIVHTWFLPAEDKLRSRHSILTEEEVDQLLSNTKKIHQQWLQSLLNEFDLADISHRVHLVKGDPGKAIPELVQKKRADLIVMGTVARTGIAGFFIGNTAEKILRAVDCSVLTVKPKAFKTPVKV